MLIGIFGGTFDPIHIGHIQLAENLLMKTEIEKILFIPSAKPPHKPNQPITPFEVRYKMVELAIAGNDSFAVTDIENRSSGLSYTVKTVKQLKEMYSGDEFTLIIGGDSLCMLHTWYKSAELIKECGITAYPRPGYDANPEELKRHWPVPAAAQLSKSLFDLPVTDISSTWIRQNFYTNTEVRKYLSTSVSEYIEEKGLYKTM